MDRKIAQICPPTGASKNVSSPQSNKGSKAPSKKKQSDLSTPGTRDPYMRGLYHIIDSCNIIKSKSIDIFFDTRMRPVLGYKIDVGAENLARIQGILGELGVSKGGARWYVVRK